MSIYSSATFPDQGGWLVLTGVQIDLFILSCVGAVSVLCIFILGVYCSHRLLGRRYEFGAPLAILRKLQRLF